VLAAIGNAKPVACSTAWTKAGICAVAAQGNHVQQGDFIEQASAPVHVQLAFAQTGDTHQRAFQYDVSHGDVSFGVIRTPGC